MLILELIISKMALLEINLEKIRENTANIKTALEDIELAAVTKGCRGDKKIAQAMVEGGACILADSHQENLKKFSELPAKKILLRFLNSENNSLESVDCICVSNKQAIFDINKKATKLSKKAGLMLLVESGLGRDGFNSEEISSAIELTNSQNNIELNGLATNTDCQNGSDVLEKLKNFISILGSTTLAPGQIISGGNSSVLPLAIEGKIPKEINQLRVGEGILLGHDTINYNTVVGNHRDAFNLKVQVLEIRKKNGQKQAVLATGYQDIGAGGLKPVDGSENLIIKQYSDHLTYKIVNGQSAIKEIWFRPDYYALNALMTSPFVKKRYINTIS